jgi:hypothetical protein
LTLVRLRPTKNSQIVSLPPRSVHVQKAGNIGRVISQPVSDAAAVVACDFRRIQQPCDAEDNDGAHSIISQKLACFLRAGFGVESGWKKIEGRTVRNRNRFQVFQRQVIALSWLNPDSQSTLTRNLARRQGSRIEILYSSINMELITT